MSPKASVASRLTTVMADLLHDGWPLSHVEGGHPQLIHPLANLLISLAEACSIVRRRATAGVSLDRSLDACDKRRRSHLPSASADSRLQSSQANRRALRARGAA